MSNKQTYSARYVCSRASAVTSIKLTVTVEERREREKFIHHKANNRCDNQNKLMWQAAREEIPI